MSIEFPSTLSLLIINLFDLFNQIKGTTKNLLKGGSDVDDALVAVVIRNLKLVKVLYLTEACI
jgi:hypothetical protein